MQVATSDVELWPEDENVVPLWRLEQERRALEFGFTLPRYRTKQEFQAHVELCVERLERVKPEPKVERSIPPLVPLERRGTRSEGHARTLNWINEFREIKGDWPRWTEVFHTLELTRATASRRLAEAKRLRRATIPERLAA